MKTNLLYRNQFTERSYRSIFFYLAGFFLFFISLSWEQVSFCIIATHRRQFSHTLFSWKLDISLYSRTTRNVIFILWLDFRDGMCKLIKNLELVRRCERGLFWVSLLRGGRRMGILAFCTDCTKWCAGCY